MVELKGSEKQIKWAEDIRKNYLETLDKMVVGISRLDKNYIQPIIRENKEGLIGKLDKNYKNMTSEEKWNESARVILEMLTELKEKIEAEESSKKFIDVYNSHKYFASHEVSATSILKEFR